MGLSPTKWRKEKNVGYLMKGESATEHTVQGGGNYNGPKIEKFLVR